MISTLSSNYSIFPVNQAEGSGRGSQAGGPGAGLEGLDVVEFSGAGRLLANEPLLLPTAANVRKLSAALSAELGQFLREAGLEGQGAVEFELAGDGQLRVKGQDADRVAGLLAANPDLAERLRTLAAISSHACQMEEHLRFQRDYRAGNNPQEVVARYGHLFARGPQITLSFDRQELRVLVDGRAWPDG